MPKVILTSEPSDSVKIKDPLIPTIEQEIQIDIGDLRLYIPVNVARILQVSLTDYLK